MVNSPIIRTVGNIEQGDNALIEISRDLNGAVKICIRDSKHPEGYAAAVSPRNAIAIAMTILEKAGIPVSAELARRTKQFGDALGGVP